MCQGTVDEEPPLSPQHCYKHSMVRGSAHATCGGGIYPGRPLNNLEVIAFCRSVIIFIGLEECSAGTFRI